jgi:hypothetical protein
MKTITKQIEAYTFTELSESAKQNVINWLNQYPDFDPSDDEGLIDNESLKIKSYALASWDTNSIECRFGEIEFDIDSLIAELSESIRDQRNLYRCANIYYAKYVEDMHTLFYTKKNHNYRNMRLDFEAESPCKIRSKRVDTLIEKYREKLENHLRHCEHLAAKSINAEVNYRYSEEYAKDTCEANEYLFDSNGHVI